MSQWRGATHSGWDPTEYRFHIYTLVLAAQLSHATGYAMGVQRDGSDEIVACYFGDGAASEGEANEALNWAAAGNAPVLFFCQNNHWAISTPVSIQMKSPMHERARGFGLEAHVVDGNDVLGVHAAVTAAAARVRSGAGPVLVEAVTYRMAGHSTSDDPKRYRTQEELEAWAARDPIARLEAFMEREGWLVDELVFEIKEACDEIAAVAREACRAIRPGSLEELFENVLAEPTSLLASERREYAELEASYVD
jgi:2-oxoisovalerate dehydrogenase E1 component alpha subunit